jgi:predicted transcriptional regulator
MPSPNRNAVNVSGETKDKIEKIAKGEDRSLSQMVRILLNEAIAVREDTQEASLQEIVKKLRTFDLPTLVKVIEEAVKLINQRISASKEQS